MAENEAIYPPMEALFRGTVFSSDVLGARSLDWFNYCAQGLRNEDEVNLISEVAYYKSRKDAFFDS